MSGSNLNGYAGRIVFTENVYDIQSLFLKKKVIKLQSAFNDLPLILDRKSNIHQVFKEYTGDLVYDLNVYKKTFDGLDWQYRDEPPEVKESIQKTIIDKEGKEYSHFLNDKLLELSDIVSNFSSKEHQRHGFYFRQQIWNFIRCSAFMTRTNIKPRGYAGDSKMMKMVYANEYIGNTTFEKLMHKFALDQPGATSVRNRRKIVVKLINTINKDVQLSENQKFRILSVACGPAVELQDILISVQDFAKYHFTLLDQDRLALEEASQVVEELENKIGAKVDAAFVPASVRMIIANRGFKQKFGQFHFIYSMGLFDYLSPRVGSVVIENLYQLLKPGGRMVIGNFHVVNQSKHFLNYWLDWNLYHRCEKEFLMLSKTIPTSEASIFFENTGNQMFLEIKKAETK
jgi:extracellular factor (EF) 3-hydroxypalmitic acid methyl ester biosynthesis protein